MKAKDAKLVDLLQVRKQFVIPIYQRKYSWTEEQCEQRWDDLIRITSDEKIPSHFIGSVVYIIQSQNTLTDVSPINVIDGQQRLVTVSLLLAALEQALKRNNDDSKAKEIRNDYLVNNLRDGNIKHKLILTQNDKETLIDLLDERPLPEKYSKQLKDNFEYFKKKIKTSNIDLMEGIRKLCIVEIALEPKHDDPQLIFESLNSTGLELSQTDLIRNYIMIDRDPKDQEKIYNYYWRPMEKLFEESNGMNEFDRFMRDYLTINTGQIPNIRSIYTSFKEYATRPDKNIDNIIRDIYDTSKFFVKLAFENEKDRHLNHIIQNINTLKVDVAYPFLIEVLMDYDKERISKNELYEVFMLVENYVFRRSICDVPTNSLNKTFANLAAEIDKDKYLESLKAIFNLKDSYRKFPTDFEFNEKFCDKNIYNYQNRKYLFEKLENHDEKERRDIDKYSIEHIMPQNKNSKIWRDEIGLDYEKIHEKYLHTIGNLTITGYNPEYSDKSFLEKKTMKNGLDSSPINLNAYFTSIESWNKTEIVKRATVLARLAQEIWKFPNLDSRILEIYANKNNGKIIDGEEDGEESDTKWSDRLKNASDEIQELIKKLRSNIEEKFDCVIEPQSNKLGLYVEKPTTGKNRFGLIGCGKNTATVFIRIDPKTFEDDEYIRIVAGWFFPRGTERRISVTQDNIPYILDRLEHSYQATRELQRSRFHH